MSDFYILSVDLLSIIYKIFLFESTKSIFVFIPSGEVCQSASAVRTCYQNAHIKFPYIIGILIHIQTVLRFKRRQTTHKYMLI